MFCKKTIVFRSLTAVLSAIVCSGQTLRDANFQWSDCGGANASIRWQDIQVQEPVKLKNLTIGLKYEIVREVVPGSYSKLEIWRMMKLLFVPFNYKLPCTKKFGSCDYDVCRVMDADNFCRFQDQFAGNCGCPMTPKVVEGYNFKVQVPDRKIGAFQSLFAEGQYKVKWTWYNPKSEKIACLEGQGHINPFNLL